MQKDNLKLEGLGSFTVIFASLCVVAYVCYFFGFHNVLKNYALTIVIQKA